MAAIAAGKVVGTMKKLVVMFALLACTGIAAASAAEAPPSITITGNGKIFYTPDMGYIHVGISSDGVTAAEAWGKNEAIVKRIFEALKDLGIEEKDFKTTNLNLQPRYHREKDKAPKFLGYTASYNLTVTVRQLKQMSTLLDRMVEAGANRNMNISFGYSRMDELIDQARTKAVTEARKRANLYVTGANPGARLGDVLAISDGSHHLHSPMHQVDVRAIAEGNASLPVAAGEQEVNVNVTVRWAIDNHRIEP